MKYINFSNYSILYASCLPFFGGAYGSGARAGAFFLNVSTSAAVSFADVGGRLIFL